MTTGRPCSDALPDEASCLGPGRLWVAAFLAALSLYVLTLSPDLVWQDGGEYQWTSARLSWPPAVQEDGRLTAWCRPGETVRVHPWFLVTARALGLVPFWNYAYAANVSSAIGMALAAANMVLLVRLVTGRTAPALIAGLSFGLGHTIWTFAVMSEVLGWTAAFLSAECLLAWLWIDRRRVRWLLALFLVNGVAISNHMMAALSLAVFGTWMVVACVRRRAPAWAIPASVALWILGGTLYWIVGAVEYGRVGSLTETLRSMTSGHHGASVMNVGILPGLLGRSLVYVGLNYPTPLVLAAAVGAVVLARRRDAFAVLVLALTAVYFIWAARYKVPDQYSFFVPFYVCASLLIGFGAAALITWRRWMAWLLVVLAILPVGVYAALPAMAQSAGSVFFKRKLPYRDPYTYFLQPWKRGDTSARQFAEDVLGALPANAILLPDTTSSPPLKCLRDIELRRPDVRVVDSYDAELEPDRLGRYWHSKEDLLAGLRAEGRRVFVVSEEPDYVPSWVLTYDRLERFGLIFEVKPFRPAGDGP